MGHVGFALVCNVYCNAGSGAWFGGEEGQGCRLKVGEVSVSDGVYSNSVIVMVESGGRKGGVKVQYCTVEGVSRGTGGEGRMQYSIPPLPSPPVNTVRTNTVFVR